MKRVLNLSDHQLLPSKLRDSCRDFENSQELTIILKLTRGPLCQLLDLKRTVS